MNHRLSLNVSDFVYSLQLFLFNFCFLCFSFILSFTYLIHNQQWSDYRLAWNTSEYHGIDLIRVPYNTVWLPDIVLENKWVTVLLLLACCCFKRRLNTFFPTVFTALTASLMWHTMQMCWFRMMALCTGFPLPSTAVPALLRSPTSLLTGKTAP